MIIYSYVPEDDHEIDRSQSNELDRVRSANRYPRRIRYGNQDPFFPNLNARQSPIDQGEWHFEVFFDYDEPGELNALLANLALT